MPQVVFPEFRDSTENIKYPFIDTATLTDVKNSITIPSNIIIDANIYLPGVNSMVYISSIEVLDDKVTITIQDSKETTSCVGTINILTEFSREDYILSLYNGVYKVGALVIGGDKISYFKTLNKGKYTFDKLSTAFVPSCVTMLPTQGITSLAVNDRTEQNTVYGDIWLIGWRGVTLRTQRDVSNSIRIDVMGDPLFKQAAYPDTPYEIPMPIMTINGMPANDYGNFNITTSTISDSLRINTTSTGIYIYMAGANVN